MSLSATQISQWETAIKGYAKEDLREMVRGLPPAQMPRTTRDLLLKLRTKNELKTALQDHLYDLTDTSTNTTPKVPADKVPSASKTGNERCDVTVNGVCVLMLILYSTFLGCFRHCEGLWAKNHLTEDQIGDLKTSVRIFNYLQIVIFAMALFVMFYAKELHWILRISLCCMGPFLFLYVYNFDKPLPIYEQNIDIRLNVDSLSTFMSLYTLGSVVWLVCTLRYPMLQQWLNKV